MSMSTMTFSPISKITCIKCSKAIPLYTPELSEYVGCKSCGALLDLRDEKPRVFSEGDIPTEVVFQPGDQLTIENVTYLVLGISVKRLSVERVYWQEYALYHPDQPITSLSCSEGHWHFMQEAEVVIPKKKFATIKINGIEFKRFANMKVDTIAHWGELHSDSFKDARYDEYICPPYIASREECMGNTTCFFGRYISIEELMNGTVKSHNFPAQNGVGAAQPLREWVHRGPLTALTVLFVGLMILTGIFLASRSTEITQFNITSQQQKINGVNYTLPNDSVITIMGSEEKLTKKSFHIEANHTAVELYFASKVENNWISITGYLLHEQTGEKIEFWKEVQYYTGSSSDGNWTEGQNWERVIFNNLKEGDYSIVLSGESSAIQSPQDVTVYVTINPSLFSNVFVLLLIALVFPVISYIRARSFENKRWLNSGL